MARLFRDPVPLHFVDADDRRLARVRDVDIVPRAGENVRLHGVAHVVERVGYDVVGGAITAVFVVCRPA